MMSDVTVVLFAICPTPRQEQESPPEIEPTPEADAEHSETTSPPQLQTRQSSTSQNVELEGNLQD